mgnify:FL=1
MNFKTFSSLVVLVAAALPAAAGDLSASQVVHKQIVSVDADGNPVETFVAAYVVAPGDTVRYMLQYRNDDAVPAEAVVLTMPVPEEMSYLDNSATTDKAQVSLSYDDGANYQFAPGTTEVVEASQYVTHVRWTFDAAIASGESGNVSFLATLK